MQYQYTLVVLFSKFIRYFPLKYSRLFGEALCRLAWIFAPKKRKVIAVDNITKGLKTDVKEAKKIAKASFVRFGPMFMEVFYLPKINKNNIHQYVEIEGAENLEKALALGKGAIIATAHSGNWEILGAALAIHGFPIAAVVQKQNNAAMDRFINEYRTLAGMHVTYRSSVREMIRMLSAGKVVGLLVDQDNGKYGVFVNFFGRSASTPIGAAALNRMKGSPIIPLFITYNKKTGQHKAIIHPQLDVVKTEDKDNDILVNTARLTNIVEEHIRKYPDEWFWLHNRWKTQPK